ncbi:MAG: branched-chain amino acid ABC transporter permease [Deltaproteobacteria bacterium HGW-Deltaproteobacteria-15]|jgi:branched-chain amino acid transport system permease protein|nr:MAG: branched-chain amino acid ABC transporter permease [Deltaproteobacteria bacterium HGW-Deltaproteobacteria-15]
MTSQVLLNGLLSAITYILVASGFSLVWSAARFFNFAHGAIITAGAYTAFATVELAGLPLVTSPLCAVLVSMILGWVIELCAYRPLRRLGASPLNLLLASLGLYIVLLNVIAAVFGNDAKTIQRPIVEGIHILGGRLTQVQIAMALVSLVVLGLLGWGLGYTRVGRAMRAVANNPQLASSVGLDSDMVILASIVIGSGLAGLAGSLVALDVGATPVMGMNLLLFGVVAAIAGGMGKPIGLLLGGVILGFLQHFTAWFIGTEWQDAVALTLFVLVLLVKPEGLLGIARSNS